MGFSRLVSDLISDVRERTDREVDPALEDTELITWIRQEWHKVCVLTAKLNRDEITKTQAFTIASGNTHTIAPAPDDFFDLRGVDVNIGSVSDPVWKPIKRWRFNDRGYVGNLSYYRKGRTLEIQPKELATVYPYRYHYVYLPSSAVTLVAGTALDLPYGADDFICAGVEIKVRKRFDESPMEARVDQRAALEVVTRYLATAGHGSPEPIREASPEEDG